MALNPRQRRFVAEYLVDLKAGLAAVRAGYSAHTAETHGPRLVRNGQVAAAIAEALTRREQRVEVRSDEVLRELLRIARVDVADAFEDNGKLRPLKDIPEDVRRAISGLDVEDRKDGDEHYTVRKIRFWDKPRALELLGKHLALFTDRVEATGPGGAPLSIAFTPTRRSA